MHALRAIHGNLSNTLKLGIFRHITFDLLSQLVSIGPSQKRPVLRTLEQSPRLMFA